MLIDLLESLDPLFPLDSFRVCGSVPYAKKEDMTWSKMRKQAPLSDLSAILAEEDFSHVALAWNPDSLCVYLRVDQPCTQVEYPQFAQGDAFEVFIDTRDLKESRFFHPFCHRFLFLPKEVQGVQAREISLFRKEEGHPLCDPQKLAVAVERHKDSYEMLLHIEGEALHGFERGDRMKIGFSYRLHRAGNRSEAFCLSSSHFSIEQQPRFWASFSLIPPKRRS